MGIYMLPKTSDFLQFYDCLLEKNSRENAIQKAFLSKRLCNFLFFFSQRTPRKSRKTSSEITDGVSKPAGLPSAGSTKILISKFNSKISESEITSEREFLIHFLLYTFIMKIIQREDAIQKAVPSKILGFFFSQLHVTEAHKYLRDYRRGPTTIIVKKSEWAITSYRELLIFFDFSTVKWKK